MTEQNAARVSLRTAAILTLYFAIYFACNLLLMFALLGV